MATISKLAINLGWNGQQAEDGLSRTAKKTSEAGKKADEAGSAFGRLAQALKGANDVKSGFDMLRGVTQFFIGTPIAAVGSMMKLGGELETMQIKMGLLAGSFDKGAESLENLRQITRDMGVPLDEVVGGFQQLTAAGVDTGSAEKLMRTFAEVSPLLGQGGLGQLAGGISQMAKSGIAEAATLQQMQSSGLKVYEALAVRLSNVTGQFHSVEDAINAVNNKTVQASTAVLAMQDAVKTPEAIEAAQRLFNSFDGQLTRLQQGVIELFRDIGKGLIDGLDIPAFLASLRGVIESIAIIVKELLSNLTAIMGPDGKGNQIEENFKNARDFAFQMAERLATSGNDLITNFDKMISHIKETFENIKAFFESPTDMEAQKNRQHFNRFVGNRERTDAEIAGQSRALDIANFFAGVENNAKGLDKKRAMDFAAPKERGGAFDPIRIKQKEMASTSDFTVQKLQAGSTAAVEAMVRNQLGGGKEPQQEILQEAKEQTRQGAEMLALLAGIKLPGTVQVAI